jgi:hypothetical protein
MFDQRRAASEAERWVQWWPFDSPRALNRRSMYSGAIRSSTPCIGELPALPSVSMELWSRRWPLSGLPESRFVSVWTRTDIDVHRSEGTLCFPRPADAPPRQRQRAQQVDGVGN